MLPADRTHSTIKSFIGHLTVCGRSIRHAPRRRKKEVVALASVPVACCHLRGGPDIKGPPVLAQTGGLKHNKRKQNNTSGNQLLPLALLGLARGL